MVRLESLHTETHSPHPLQRLLLILISGLSFVLDVGIGIVFLYVIYWEIRNESVKNDHYDNIAFARPEHSKLILQKNTTQALIQKTLKSAPYQE